MSPIRAYRRLLYLWVALLCVGILLQGFLAVYLVRETNQRQEENAAALPPIQDAVTLLCDRGYLISDLILQAEDLVRAAVPPSDQKRAFLRSFELHYNELLDEVTTPNSACVAP